MDDVRLTAFAPLSFYRAKVVDTATGKEHMFIFCDLGDGTDGKPFPLVVMDEQSMKQQKALPPNSALLRTLQAKILAHRGNNTTSGVPVAGVDL